MVLLTYIAGVTRMTGDPDLFAKTENVQMRQKVHRFWIEFFFIIFSFNVIGD